MKAFFIAACLVLVCFAACSSYCPISLPDRIRADVNYISSTNQVVDKYTIEGESHAKYLQPLIRYAATLNVPVVEDDLMDVYGVVGLTACREGRCVIALDQSVSGNTKVYTLMHEIAHVKIPINSIAVAEIISETTAYVASTELGMSVKQEAISYLLRFPEQLREQTIQSWAPKIETVSQDLVEAAQKAP